MTPLSPEAPVLDALILGGGLSGLSAAYTLKSAEKSFVVLEANDRLGGRVQTTKKDRRPPRDSGAEFVGTHQRYVQHMIQVLGVPMFDTALTTDRYWVYQPLTGLLQRYLSTSPMFVPGGQATLLALGVLDELALRVRARLDHLEALPKDLRDLDQITVQQWTDTALVAIIKDNGLDAELTQEVFAASIRAIFSLEADKLSMLFLLYYAATAGGYSALVDTAGGRSTAQGQRFVNGAQDLIERLRSTVCTVRNTEDRSLVRTGHTVTRIAADEHGVTVTAVERIAATETAGARTETRAFRAKRVIFAIGPQVQKHAEGRGLTISFPSEPAVQAAWQKRKSLCAAMVVGHTIKGFTTFSKPFWRERDLMGRALSATPTQPTHADFISRPIDWALDESWTPAPDNDDPTVTERFGIMTFIVGKAADDLQSLTEPERGELVAKHLSTLFGVDVNAYKLDYEDHDFSTQDPHTVVGCPTGVLGINVLTRFGSALRAPVGRVHWASTEAATEWCGYLDGAIQSGMRAADEVIAQLESEATTG